MTTVFTEDYRGDLLRLLKRGATDCLEALVYALDDHPTFAALQSHDRIQLRRLAQLELARRPDSLVSRWVRAGGLVEYDDRFHATLLGSPALAAKVVRHMEP